MSSDKLTYYYDNSRHLVCYPYSIENLHLMAKELGINKCWFHKNHYDIPKGMGEVIGAFATLIRPREVFQIIQGNEPPK